MRHYRIKIITISVLMLILGIYIFMVVRINKAFPNPKEINYTSENPANLDGLEIQPEYYELCSMKEYSEISSEFSYMSEEAAEKSIIVLAKLKLKNTTKDVINYSPNFILSIEELNGKNGALPVDLDDNRMVIMPGEERELLLEAYMGSAQMKYDKFSKIDSSTVCLIYSFYPYREKLILNKKIEGNQ